MNSQPVFELPSHRADIDLRQPAGVPLPCRRPMQAQQIAVWTPLSVLGALLMALLELPRQAMLAPSALRARTRRV